MKKLSFFLVLMSALVSCEKEALLCVDEGSQEFHGTWLLFEEGYSPGGGYIVNEVPSEPAQTVTFHDNNRMSSTVNGFVTYKYYSLVNDSLGGQILTLYKTDPTGTPPDPSSPTYIVTFNADGLRLGYRWCIEGCHLGFKRIQSN